MEGTSGSWPSYDYRPMLEGPHDHNMQPDQRDTESQRSCSYENEWRTVADELVKHRRSQGDPAIFNNIRNDEAPIHSNMYPAVSVENGQLASELAFEIGLPASQMQTQHPFFACQPLDDVGKLRQQHLSSQTNRGLGLPYPSYYMGPTSDSIMSYGSPVHGGGYGGAPPLTPNTPSPMLLESVYLHNATSEPDNTSPTFTNDDFDDSESTDPCYAQLLYRALKEAPEHTMSLRDLYHWVSAHSHKGRDPKNKGWQNSVRHNLSMNHAFERVPAQPTHPTKKGSLWRLTDRALREGVISTTRFRKDPKRKAERQGEKAPARVRSGAKGGQATRAATRRLQRERSFPYRLGPANDCEYIPPPQTQSFMDVTPPQTQGTFYARSDQPYSNQQHSPYFYGQDRQLDLHPSTLIPYTNDQVSVSYNESFPSAFDSSQPGLPPPVQQYYTDFNDPHHSYPTPSTIPGDGMEYDLDAVYDEGPACCPPDQDVFNCEQSSMLHDSGDFTFQ